jgi:GntR family transcriptional regulator/MocR family aminotransferase
MAIKWAGLGPELLLALDRDATEPLTAQLERGLREAIRSGRLTPGERLPSSRALATELRVSRGLVQECYSQLLAEGFLTSRTGSGTQVAATAAQSVPAPRQATRRPARGTAAGPPGPVSPKLDVDFLPGCPDLASFPRRDWMWAMREVSRTAPAEAVGYGDPPGSRTLREVLAGYLRRVRGAVVDAEQIVICAGFAQGINLVLRTLADTGVTLAAVEDPGDVEIGDAPRRWGLRGVAVPVDEHGIVVDELRRSGARAVVLTPAHQSPTGVVLAPERRQALARWAHDRDATIIEDDYDAEFRYDREPVGALQGLAPGRVALIGTVSKSLAPAIRMGWVVCPPHLLDAIADAKTLDDRGSPGLDQLALATLIESGRYDKHLRAMRSVYAGKRRALIESLAIHAPQVQLLGLAAGFHAVARLPEGSDERAIARAARERAIGLYPMSELTQLGRPRPPELVIGFGNLTEQAIRRGVETVADLLSPD